MLGIRAIRERREELEARLKTRDRSIDLAPIVKLDEKRRRLIAEVEGLKAERNRGSQEVGRRKKEGKDASDLLSHLSGISDRIGELDGEIRRLDEEIERLLSLLPNLPHPSVPTGPEENKVILREVGEKPVPDYPIKPHILVGEEKGILDFTRGAAMTGSRFPMYIGMGARLEMALINFMFTRHAKRGYTPVLPPFLANERSFYVSSQLPKFADDIYRIERDGLYLNPTAESLLVNIHRDEIIPADQLPKSYVAYTPCFRREAGSYGEEERGLIRVHQFNKVELFKFTTPESSYAELDSLIADAEEILKALRIHYRVVLLTTGDMAQQAAKTVDLEVYLPAQGRYYEVSSCSNCEDFQARRGNIRYRPSPKEKPRFVHTLNGSGVATSRLMAAILENNQTEDGRVLIPDVLQPMVEAVYV
ncbi:MAG TPA: serine--tRNA ligase [Candidatus Acetothermia bacterium]|nr:serine--tRNA ligase [Candidatus Acetothermia bacterium]